MKKQSSNAIIHAFSHVVPCLFITACLLIIPCFLMANPISSEQALSNAVAFLQKKGIHVTPKKIRRAPSLRKDTKEASYYVFNLGAKEGFVVASGDDQAPAVLAYADHGSFLSDSLPCNVAYWMNTYEKQIKFIKEKGITAASRKANRAQGEVIGPLLTTQWNQDAPYNETCPMDPDFHVRCLTGCVATAMAQVMYYHRHYSTKETTDDISYPYFTGSKVIPNVPKGSPIDWDNMLDKYESHWEGDEYVNDYTPEESHAVAELMRYAGTAAELTYSAMLTVGSPSIAAAALVDYFDYDECAQEEDRWPFSDSEWENKIREDLSNGKPIIYSGGGHCFVVDGYDPEGYVHINWGWGGNSDGFFLLGAFSNDDFSNAAIGEPEPEGMSYSDEVMGGYDSYQTAVFGVAPYGIYTRLTTLDMTLTSEEVEELKPTNGFFPVSFEMIVCNKNEQSCHFQQAIGLYRNKRLWCILAGINDSRTLGQGGSRGYLASLNIPDTLSRGTYQIVAMSRLDADERWHPNADRSQVITMMVRDGKARLVEGVPEVQGDIIAFRDRRVKTICLENWDANGDGELSKEEASVVKSLDGVFKGSDIYAFDELQYFTGLTSIGEEEFCDCVNLWTVTLPDGVISLGPRVFKNSNLIKIHITKNVASIGSEAFDFKRDFLEAVDVEEGNPHYDSRDNCQGIIETATGKMIMGSNHGHVPDGVKVIGKRAFYGCRIDSLALPEGVVDIEDEAFCDCYLSISLPNSLRSIGKLAFSSGFRSQTIDLRNVEEIGDYAFEYSNIKSLVIPASVRYIGKNIIKGCNYITHVEVEEDNPYYDSRDGCNAILDTKTDKLIAGHMMSVIPSSTKIIGEEAFCHSSFGRNVTLPTGLVSIEDRAFYFCNFMNLDIPEGVTSIGDHAFEGCYYMSSFSLPSSLTHIGDSAFKTVSDIVHHVYVSARTPLAIPDVFFGRSDEDYLYVPKGSKAAYMAADYWNHFNVIEMTGVRGDLNFDGKVTVADVMVLIDIIVGRESVFRPVYLCDLNIDNKVTVADVMQMVDMILLK